MKKIILVAVVAGMTALVSCGDDAEVKRLADSTEAARIADSTKAAADTAAAVKAREDAAAAAKAPKGKNLNP